ncbi:MAG: methyltransferase [Clostridia bacterium]|nr:methyltransferase [Clostridia bacterium]
MDKNLIISENESIIAVGDRVKMISNGKGLAWGSDSYLLAARLRRGKRACELGCGTGVVTLLAAAFDKFNHVTALEVEPESAALAERNVALNSLSDKVTVKNIDIHEAHPKDLGGEFDCVFSNPPYFAHPGPESPDSIRQSARHEIHGGISDFCAAAARLLRYGGTFVCVYRPDRLVDLFEAMRAAKLEPKKMCTVYADTNSKPAFVLVEAKFGGAPLLEFEPPLFLYTDEITNPRIRTERIEKIYEKTSFEI